MARLSNEFGLTQEMVAEKVGKSRASVANILRLLKLSRNIKEDLISEKISMGHARALLGLRRIQTNGNPEKRNCQTRFNSQTNRKQG